MKYDVMAGFPYLDLRTAAANNNIGLVKYALSDRQRINSVLDCYIPFHLEGTFLL